MRILIVSLFFPYPQVTHAGGTNLFHYIEGLSARGHQVSLASFIKEQDRPYVESMRPYCSEIKAVPELSSFGQRLAKAPSLLRYPWTWVEASSRAMRRVLGDMLCRQEYDIVHFEHLWMTQYLDLVHGCKTALDEVDVDSVVLFRRYRRAQAYWEKQYLLWCWRRTVQLEVAACERVDLVFARSDKDRKYLQCLALGKNIQELGPWCEGIGRPRPPDEMVEEHSLLFVGNMGRRHNIEAVLWFHDHIFSIILERVPDARLYIVGDSPSEQVSRLAGERVIVTGYVEDLSTYYARCQVFVAPLLVGGGIIVKILDALAAGRPVVCTSVGNEGIEAIPGRDLYVADSPGPFAERVIELLTQPRRWREMAGHARGFFERKYDWEGTMDQLEQAYVDLLPEGYVGTD